VLFLGGPRRADSRAGVGTGDGVDPRRGPLEEIRDAMAGGAAGLAVGRVVFQDPEPATMARLVADAVREGAHRAPNTVPA
jgi:DhnA family fructose-bisphosphate aldolase class Ia